MAIKDLSKVHHCLFICNGGTCLKQDADALTLEIRRTILELGAQEVFHTVRTKCMGRCEEAPVLMSAPEGKWFGPISVAQTKALVVSMLAEDKWTHPHCFFQFKLKPSYE
jgi:(2Fe-2S) ferredoxin